MYPANFEHCCGAVEIGEFGSANYQQVKSSILTTINDYKSEVTMAQEDGFDPVEVPGAMVATTVPSQRPAIRALKALKFKQALTFVNPGTGNKVTLWVKKLTY